MKAVEVTNKMERGKIYLIRHAQSRYNQASADLEASGKKAQIVGLKWQPQYIDVELSEFGERQAELAIPSAHALRLRMVFVSPLRRALRTAQILFENHPDQPRIIVHPQLVEKLKNAPDVSVYSGRPYSQFAKFDWSLFNSSYFLFDIVKNTQTEELGKLSIEEIPMKLLEVMEKMVPEKIETAAEMYKRTQASKEIWKRHANNGNIALVAHSNFFKFYTMKFEGNEKSYRWMQNCEMIDSDELQLGCLNKRKKHYNMDPETLARTIAQRDLQIEQMALQLNESLHKISSLEGQISKLSKEKQELTKKFEKKSGLVAQEEKDIAILKQKINKFNKKTWGQTFGSFKSWVSDRIPASFPSFRKKDEQVKASEAPVVKTVAEESKEEKKENKVDNA